MWYGFSYLGMPRASIDGLLRALASPRRRRTCAYLAELDDPVATVDDIAEHLRRVERESGRLVSGRREVALALHHTDLPKLDDLGVVEFDPRDGVVRYHGDPTLERVLQAVSELEPAAC